MHMAGPREAIQHMIIRKNYGACLICVYALRARVHVERVCVCVCVRVCVCILTHSV